MESSSEEKAKQDKILLQPFHYITQIPGKLIRTKLAQAFNTWLNVKIEKLNIISDALQILHNASLLIDDIEDNSQMRRGVPVAHHIYGVATTINAANYAYILGLEKILQLDDPQTANVYTEQLLELHRGQGMEIYWRDNFVCPTEDEYKQMVIKKTGGLFGLAVRLMQLFSDNKNDFSRLTGILGFYFQVRDDYSNLCSKEDHKATLDQKLTLLNLNVEKEYSQPVGCHTNDNFQYTEHKSFCEDLTEGKYSFPIIHAIHHHPEDSRIINILRQRTTDVEIKKYFIHLLTIFGSFKYTRDVLADLDKQAIEEVERLGGNPFLLTILDGLRTWKDDEDVST